MTAINRAIAQAKSGASHVMIRDKDVRGMAEHFRMLPPRPLHIDHIEDNIRQGRVMLLGVHIIVEGGDA